jgi:LPXTG-motif cell wall-anchored protein
MRTLLIKGRLLLPAVAAALLLAALALGGTASAWGGGDRDEAKGVAEHTGSVYDNGKAREHGDNDHHNGDKEDSDREHGDDDHHNGDKEDSDREHGDDDHDNGDKDDDNGDNGADHGDNDHGDNDHHNGDKEDNEDKDDDADHGDNDHDNGDKDDNDHGDKDEDHEGPGKDVPGPGGQAGAGGQVVTQVAPVASVPAQVSPVAGNEAAPESTGQGGVLGQGGEAGPELAQVQGGEQPATGAGQQQQPAQLASTGSNVVPLLILGALCVAASILLLRRRTSV